MTKVLMMVRHPDGAPDLQAVKRRYGLSDDEIDADYGVVDLGDGTYTVQVEEQAAWKLAGATTRVAGDPYPGPYANPCIAPFGPPEAASPAGDSAGDAERATGAAVAEERAPPSGLPGGHPPTGNPRPHR